jgi:hypothetical protein
MMMTMRRVLLLVYSLCSWATVYSFTVPRTKSRSIAHGNYSPEHPLRRRRQDDDQQLRPSTTALLLASKKDNYYNDDAFGLILIGSSIVSTDDYSFPALFAALSAGALLSVRFGVLPENDARLPAVVAVGSLLGSALYQQVVQGNFSFSRELAFEAAVTCVSVVWCLIQYNSRQQ